MHLQLQAVTSKTCNWKCLRNTGQPMASISLYHPSGSSGSDKDHPGCSCPSQLHAPDTYIPQALADTEDTEHHIIPEWRNDTCLLSIPASRARNGSAIAKDQIDILKTYFISTAGSVPWQEQMLWTFHTFAVHKSHAAKVTEYIVAYTLYFCQIF